MGRFKTFVKPNATNTDYECWYRCKDGSEYSQDRVRCVRTIDGDEKTTRYYLDDGTVLNERKTNIISNANSKAYLGQKTFDVSKSKNAKRTKVSSDGRHIIDCIQDYKDYLQVSTGSTHLKRGIITVDIDETPYGYQELCLNDDKIACIRSSLTGKFKLCDALGIPRPTSYQVHLTNGHVQLFWVLDDEIAIKYAQREADCGKKIYKKYSIHKTSNWERYHNTLRFLAIVFQGDFNYTGWQIKNMFLDDKVVWNKEFATLWNNNGRFLKTMPKELHTCNFFDLFSNIRSLYDCTDIFEFKNLYRIFHRYGIYNDEAELANDLYEYIINRNKAVLAVFSQVNGVGLENDKAGSIEKRIDRREAKEAKDYVLRHELGRNQFVRFMTYEAVRTHNGVVSQDECRSEVRAALEDMLCQNGKLGGTKNIDVDYTDDDFERDFNGAYEHAILTYDKNFCTYTDRQRQNGIEQNNSKKTFNKIVLTTILYNAKHLIRNSAKNNAALVERFKSYDIKVSSRTVYNYKKELGICSNTKCITLKHFNTVMQEFGCYFSHVKSVMRMKDSMESNGVLAKQGTEEIWENRLNSIYNESVIYDFLYMFDNIRKNTYDDVYAIVDEGSLINELNLAYDFLYAYQHTGT